MYSAFGVADNMRQEKDGLMAGLHEDGDRGRNRAVNEMSRQFSQYLERDPPDLEEGRFMLAQISRIISNVYPILSTSLISKYLQKSAKYLRVVWSLKHMTHLQEPSPNIVKTFVKFR